MTEERYSRQIPVFGEEGQRRIMDAVVGIAGCGGLGVNVVTQLAVAGVSHFILCDPQIPDETNLNRQFVYHSLESVPKVDTLSEWVSSLNPYARIETHHESVTLENGSMFSGCDVIVDCLDNMEGRMVLSDLSESHGIPLVHAGVQDTFGQVAVCIPGRTPSLRGMIGTLPNREGTIPSVGAAVSVIAGMEAMEVLKLLAGMESDAVGSMVTLDMSSWTMESLRFS